MTIAKAELVKLAEQGFTLSKSPHEQDRLRGYYALCFVVGSAETAQYVDSIKNKQAQLTQLLEQRILNHIND